MPLEHRNAGIGREMIKRQLAAAARHGYRVFGLDVADTNPRAEMLYRRLGLNIVAHKQFTGKRDGMCIPNAKKMELTLR